MTTTAAHPAAASHDASRPRVASALPDRPLTFPFRPLAPCGPTCLDDGGPRVGWHVRIARVVALVAVLLLTAIVGAAVRLIPSARRRGRAAARVLRASARAMLVVFGVQVDRRVRLPAERALLVANHVSWLDIVALLASDTSGRMRLVAKVEVARWPVIGGLATSIGTIFIDRNRPRTLPDTLAEVRAALRAGDVVVVFAEGTTTCGAHRMPYRPAMFQAALDAQARVVPVTIRYSDADGEPTTAPSFLGDETLAESIGRVLRMRSVRAGLRLAPTLFPQVGADRRRLARAAQQAAAREVRRTVITRAPETSIVATELATTTPLPATIPLSATAPAALTIANA